MAPSISIDESLWPLLISRFEAQVSDADYVDYLQQGSRYLQRAEPYVCVFDMARLALPSVYQRHVQREWMRRHEPLMREWVLGCAFVITTPVIRIALSSILHVVPLPMPHVAVQDLTRAVAWAASRLAETGHPEAAARVLDRFQLRGSAPP